MTSVKGLFCAILISFLQAGLPLVAERISFKGLPDVCVDIPEDYLVSGSNKEGTAFQLDYALAPVTAVIRIYSEGRFSSAKEAPV